MNELEKQTAESLLNQGNIPGYLQLMQAAEIRVRIDQLSIQLQERERRIKLLMSLPPETPV